MNKVNYINTVPHTSLHSISLISSPHGLALIPNRRESFACEAESNKCKWRKLLHNTDNKEVRQISPISFVLLHYKGRLVRCGCKRKGKRRIKNTKGIQVACSFNWLVLIGLWLPESICKPPKNTV